MSRKSRYDNCLPFAGSDPGTHSFQGKRARVIGAATAVLEHTIAVGDRLDLLADHYYGNDRMWWRILDANPGFQFAGVLLSEEMTGQVILIPRALE